MSIYLPNLIQYLFDSDIKNLTAIKVYKNVGFALLKTTKLVLY